MTRYTLAAACVFSVFSKAPVWAYTVVPFNPETYYSPLAVPTQAEVDALDTASGITGFAIEDFEDQSLLQDLTTNVALTLQTHSGTPVNQFEGAWDGNQSLEHVLRPGSTLSFNYSPGTPVFAIGITGIGANERILINGSDDLGLINQLSGFQPQNRFQRCRSLPERYRNRKNYGYS